MSMTFEPGKMKAADAGIFHFSGFKGHAIRKRQTLCFLSPLSCCLDNEVSLQGSQGCCLRTGSGDYPAGLRGTGRSDHQWRSVVRSRPHVRVDPAKTVGERLHAQSEGALVTQGADGVPTIEEALLGAAFLGQGVLFNHQRRHHRRCHTSVFGKPFRKTYRRQPVVV